MSPFCQLGNAIFSSVNAINIVKTVVEVSPQASEEEYIEQNIFQISLKYYSISREAIRKNYILSIQLERYLEKMTLNNLITCFLVNRNDSLDTILGKIINTNLLLDPLTGNFAIKLKPLMMFNTTYIKQKFEDVSGFDFCFKFYELVKEMYEPYLLDYINFAKFKTSRITSRKFLDVVGLETAFEDFIKSEYLGNCYMQEKAGKSIIKKLYYYGETKILHQDFNILTIYGMLENITNVSANIIENILKYGKFSAMSSVFSKMNLDELKTTLRLNDLNSLKDLFTEAEATAQAFENLLRQPIILIADKASIQGTNQTTKLKPTDLLQRYNSRMTKKLILSYLNWSSVIKTVITTNLPITFKKHVPTENFNTLIHIDLSILFNSHKFPDFINNSDLRNSYIVQGYRSVFTLTSIVDMKRIYGIKHNDMRVMTIFEVLLAYVGSGENAKNRFGEVFNNRTTLIFFQKVSFNFLRYIYNMPLNETSLMSIDSNIEGKCNFSF